MSDLSNKDQNINELKFTQKSISMDNFVYSINKSKNEIIIGEDNHINLIPIDTAVERESIECDKSIKCILYENEKIFYNQEKELYMRDYSSLDNTSLLTSLTSTISKILYNKKFNYVVCYDEDDNIHIVEIPTKKVNQYKSENKCSIKNGEISKNQKYLFLLGTDGQLTVYEFNSLQTQNTALNIIHRIKNFLPKNILENKNWDGIMDSNEKNIFISGGEALLKIIDLNEKELKPNSSTDFTCIDEINYAKFITDDIILLSDIKNNIKIFNFKTKKLIMKFDCSKENESKPFDNLDMYVHKDDKNEKKINIELIYGNSGNLNISDKINIPELTDNLDEKIVDALFDELDEDKDGKDKDNNDNEDIEKNKEDNKSHKSNEKMDQA